ncbi:MAG: Dabb family protein [Dehalococcoidia bacterium]|nr:Dabb family protein [Dehalococcoidia bacterium]
MIRRVVSVKFKEGTSTQQAQQYVDTVRGFPGRVPVIKRLSSGPHASDGDDSVAFSHVSVVDFETMEDLQAFLKHPAHRTAADRLFRQIVE